uniref:Uncharacterized protein n=1 Tax=Arundo donax TaxID=35708 RepID=A0A0A9HI38_ARUDO
MLSRGFKDQVNLCSVSFQLVCTAFIARCFAISLLHHGCLKLYKCLEPSQCCLTEERIKF